MTELAVTSAAAPELTLDALAAACRLRGLDGVEVVHSGDDPESLAESLRSLDGRVVALRVEALLPGTAPGLARASARLGAPVSVPRRALSLADLPDVAAIFARAGGRLLLSHATDLGEVLAVTSAIEGAVAAGSLGLAWEIRPGRESLDEASAIVCAAGEHLGLVRLFGGGPEQREQDGLGVGNLFVDLAVSGSRAPVVLCPSGPEVVPRWGKWLASQRSSGCGSQSDARARALELDVRDVEPRDRLETILGAYRSLTRGKTLRLTVDHDPSCMYYTLKATEPEGSFTFQHLEHGPEVWCAEVTKLA